MTALKRETFLAIDIGNSRIVMGFFEGKEEPMRIEIPSHPPLKLSEYKAFLEKKFFPLSKILLPTKVALSCVVPDLLPTIQELVRQMWRQEPYVISYQKAYGIPVRGTYPSLLIGSDLLANASYALSHTGNSIVVDLGTALTLIGINHKKGFMGGTITLGIQTSLQCLSSSTALLPLVPLILPSHVLNTNTEECIQSGTIRGYKHLIEGLVKDVKEEMKQEESEEHIRVLATGGLSFLVKDYPIVDLVDKNITLKGIKLLYEKVHPL